MKMWSMKKILIIAGIILSISIAPVQHTKAQIPILEIIKGAVKKVIKAVHSAARWFYFVTAGFLNPQL